MDNIAGFDSFENAKKYRVVDWVNVRSGMKHEYDYFETGEDFVIADSTNLGNGNRYYQIVNEY